MPNLKTALGNKKVLVAGIVAVGMFAALSTFASGPGKNCPAHPQRAGYKHIHRYDIKKSFCHITRHGERQFHHKHRNPAPGPVVE